MSPRTAIAYLPQDRAADAPSSLEVVGQSDELRTAAGLLTEHEARVLFVARLRDAVASPRDLLDLLDWLSATGAALVSAEPPLDTSTVAGRQTVAVLRELDRAPEAPRRGRPGIASASPDLAERIAALRNNGLSLHAIAAQLNREGVPTPRGGATWRASSVQSAIGYRRPRRPPGPHPPKAHRPPHQPPKPKPRANSRPPR
jgi:hypothetical protein